MRPAGTPGVGPFFLLTRRLCSSDDAARRAVERAVGTEEGALW
jgi:hypothetical protein